MIVYLISQYKINTLTLPQIKQGSYWLTYQLNGKEDNLINITASNDRWMAKSNEEATIYYNEIGQPEVILDSYQMYKIKVNEEYMYLYTSPTYDPTFHEYAIVNNSSVKIGKASDNDIIYNNQLIGEHQLQISFENGTYVVHNLDNQFNIYVNKRNVSNKILGAGDTIFIMGLQIIFMNNFLVINNPNNQVQINRIILTTKTHSQATINNNIKEDPYAVAYTDDDCFEKSPRFITAFENQTVKVDAPPEKKQESEMPFLYTIGPMLTMGMVSMVTGWNAINRMANGESFSSALPSLVMAIAMVMTMVFWPILSNRFQKKLDKKKEEERQGKYQKYLIQKSNNIRSLMMQEKQVLIENNVSLEECQNIIFNKKRNLWEKEIHQKDFLTVNLGLGSKKPNITIEYPEEHFSLNEDNLKSMMFEMINKRGMINDVPIVISLAEKNISAVIGDNEITNQFFDSILLQLMTFHSYRDLKIVFLSNTENNLEYLKMAPYLFDDYRQIRFYGVNQDDVKQISNYLEQVFNSRKYIEDNKISKYDYKNYAPYYLIIVEDPKMTRSVGIIKKILNSEMNYGFSIIFRSRTLSNLPKQCSTFITIDGENGKTSGFFENELIAGKQQAFVADLNIKNRVNMERCITTLNKIPLQINDSAQKLPKVVSFLEMYNVGKVEQLNSSYLWNSNNPTISLNVPIGIDENGELFKLDLHEKQHGPHGLIAGMTGSGKSEFIITYILSLAVNFHPYEVSFVLIDYKGGGLAGAFENKDTGVSLPHLAGTITNLDTIEMNRALASIHSELNRRQKIFNATRDKLGESTIDIYKYQRYYREGLVDTPVSHLFIISDEFAELKVQQPEFMKELISTARIGRSLGVHLILATQKPSGIVDDQIWSNSKFRVCLKVQDKADSKDMIGIPAAASLVDVGRFYLQVGYNELFALGQSAWCGAPYYPQEKRQKKVDTSIGFIDNIGNVFKNVSDNNMVTVKPEGEELTNIVKYLSLLANNQNIKVNKLWLDKIPAYIYIDKLRKKYNYVKENKFINPVIGEFDDPNNQRQDLLTLNLSLNGNTLIYGTANSGKEDLLTTIVYSTIIDHGADEVNIYILDFGLEFLKVFKNAPQVGDIVFSLEEEKVENLFKMLNGIIDARKKVLGKYNGDFNLYNKNSENPLPTIIIIINNYEAFLENYETVNESLITLSRDCFKYGIVLIITATAPNSVRYKLGQNFKEQIPLQLNDNLDYVSVVGKTGGVYPSDISGRGLIKRDNIYEFQTALVCEKEKQNSFIENVCLELRKNAKYIAKQIPVLPERITLDMLKSKINQNGLIPVGVYKNDLSIAIYNFKANYTTLITSINPDTFNYFLPPLLNEFTQVFKTIVIDTLEVVKNNSSYSYYSNHFNKIIESLNDTIIRQNEIYKENDYNLDSLNNEDNIMCVIIGFSNLYNRLDSEHKKTFEQMMIKGADTRKVLFVLVDTADQFKTYEYNEWYKTAITKNNGIWLGSGLSDQTTIKVTRMPKDRKKDYGDNYGYVIILGSAKFTKMLGDDPNGK